MSQPYAKFMQQISDTILTARTGLSGMSGGFAQFAVPSRPPALGPRRRGLAPDDEARVASWLRGALQVPLHERVELSEWTSMDSRAVPHVLFIAIGARGARRCFAIEKAAERIVEADFDMLKGTQSQS
jgi:hypothetical protein